MNTEEQEISYYVVIEHEGDTARLECASLEEAKQVRRSFVNWGGYQSVRIDSKDPTG